MKVLAVVSWHSGIALKCATRPTLCHKIMRGLMNEQTLSISHLLVDGRCHDDPGNHANLLANERNMGMYGD